MRNQRHLLTFEIPAALLLAMTLSVPDASLAAEGGAGKGGGKAAANGSEGGSKEEEPADSFTVVQVGDKVSVLKSSEVPGLRKKVSEEHEASVKAYNEAKQKAAKAKKKFETEKPVKPQLRVVAPALKTEESAKAIQEKTVAQIAERKKKEKERKEKEREQAKNGK